MAAHAIRVDELQYRGFLGHVVVLAAAQAWNRHRTIRLPMHRLVRDFQVRENLLVKPVFAFEQRLQAAQKHARFRALNHAVIVGAGHRHHLAEAQQGAQLSR